MNRLLYCLGILIAANLIYAASAEMQKQFSVQPGETISLDLRTGGSVRITGWDRNEVLVAARPRGEDAADCNIEITRVPGGVNVLSEYEGSRNRHSTDFRFEISAPKKYNVSLDSSGGGITIIDLNGNFKGDTGGGEITIKGSEGTVYLSTGGGQIHLEDSKLEGKVSTGGGQIVLRNVRGNVKTTTGGGQVIHEANFTDRPDVLASSDEKVVEIKTGGGAIRIDSAPLGADVETGGGEITIHSAKRFAKATTGGGDIEIKSIDGSVKASTGAGDVSVQMTGNAQSEGHDVSLSSGKGDITLILPPSFSGSVYVKLGYTRTHDDVDIVSDFDLQRDKTDEWSSAEGTPRRYIYGKGQLGSGKNRIRIETVNGNVYLKKAAK